MKVKYRITFHFLAQFLTTFIAIFFMLILFILLAMHLIIGDELNSNPEKAIVENLPFFVEIEDGVLIIPENWETIVQENDMWVQIVNRNGEVIKAIHTPDSLDDFYTMNDLLLIEEKNRLHDYTVATSFETLNSESLFYLFGFIDERQQRLNDWYEAYHSEGLINDEEKIQLEHEVNQHAGTLEIYQDGKLVEKIGDISSASPDKLNVLESIYAPGNQKTNAYVVNDEANHIAWVFSQPNEAYQEEKFQIFSNTELKFFIFVTAISIIIPVILSLWYGYRYGKPLSLLINWLNIVEQAQYQEVLSGKAYQKIYKKNGKVKFRYRLYKGVFTSFTTMSEKLAKAEKDRRQLEKTREEWMAGISHDLRTPLSSMQGYGHLLESGQYDYTTEELQTIGKVIREKSDYMVDLVNDFSLIFQLKNNVITIQKERVEMNEFIRSTLATYERDFTLSSNIFSFDPSPTTCEAEIDPKWFQRVLDNLLSNAIKHNPPHTKVHVSVRCEPSQTKIVIADNGIGMDESLVDHLFHRYYRGTNTNERSEGEGLGMGIAYGIVELHGGQIEIQSEVNKGTTIRIVL